MAHGKSPQLDRRSLNNRRPLSRARFTSGFSFGPLASKRQKHMRDIDLHGADFTAGSAQRRRKGQVFRFAESDERRRDDRTNRALIDGAISVAAYLLIHGARIQTRSASQAVERFALLFIFQNARAAIVEQYKMKLSRAIGFARASR